MTRQADTLRPLLLMGNQLIRKALLDQLRRHVADEPCFVPSRCGPQIPREFQQGHGAGGHLINVVQAEEPIREVADAWIVREHHDVVPGVIEFMNDLEQRFWKCQISAGIENDVLFTDADFVLHDPRGALRPGGGAGYKAVRLGDKGRSTISSKVGFGEEAGHRWGIAQAPFIQRAFVI